MSEDPQITSKNYPLRTIYFYLTEDCNLRCRHCWLAPDYQSEATSKAYLSLPVFKSIIEEAMPLGLRTVKLTGGEPLFHPDIVNILEFIKEKGLVVNIESNGVLITPEIARLIASCNAFISVSVDGTDAETHEWVRCVDGCFEDALNGIRNLVSAGLRPQVVMSLMRRNVGQIKEVTDLATSLGVSSIKFNLITPTSRGEILHGSGESLTIEELINLGNYVENTLQKSVDIPLFYSHPVAFKPLSNMMGKNSHGCGKCGILEIVGVLADGSYALCGIGKTVPELIYGKYGSVSLKDVWENNPVIKELRKGLPGRLEGVCADCMMKQVCIGSCIALNYYRHGSLWAPFWYCEEAQKRGLFPQSRLYSKDLLTKSSQI